MFSGGLDSTYLLWHYLTNTKHDVHAHHVHIENLEPNYKQEAAATEKIYAYCKNKYRDFRTSESRFEFKFPYPGWDSDIISLVAARLAPNIRADKIVMGWVKDDLERPVVVERAKREVTHKLWEALRNSCDYPTPEKLDYPIIGKYKHQLLSELPKELADLTWSCRKAGPVPCGKCHACKAAKSLIYS
jgi:7-cyano-7-deazaguanine synthase in queuosine biosynthesis